MMLHGGDSLSALIASTLRDADGAPMFSSATQIGELLTDAELNVVGGAVTGALRIVAPSYMGDIVEVQKTLREGAEHPANVMQTVRLGSSCDIIAGPTSVIQVHRPERYFGLAPCEMTEGHWMAAQAAREVVEKLRKTVK